MLRNQEGVAASRPPRDRSRWGSEFVDLLWINVRDPFYFLGYGIPYI